MKRLFKTILLLFVAIIAIGQSQDTTYMVLSTGSYQGGYYAAGNQIASILNQELEGVEVIPASSGGSIENIKRMNALSADLIIAQRDILVESFYDENDPLKNIEILLPLFPEAMQIIVGGEKDSISFNNLRQKIKDGSITKLAMGQENSATNIASSNIFDILGLQVPDSIIYDGPISSAINKFNNGEIDAICFFSAAPIDAIADSKEIDYALVSFSLRELKILEEHMVNLNRVTIPNGTYNNQSKQVNTIGTWALLATTSQVYETIKTRSNANISKVLINGIRSSNSRTPFWYTYNDSSHFAVNETQKKSPYLKLINSTEADFFRGLPLSNDLRNLLGIYNYLRWYGLATIIIVLLVALTVALSKWMFNSLVLVKFWIRYNHFIYASLAMLVLFVGIAELILFFERDYFNAFSVKGDLLSLSRTEFYKWIALKLFGGADTLAVFPLSLGAQISLASLFPLSLIAPAIFATSKEVIFRINNNKRKKGKMSINTKDHYVICGWNKNALSLIDQISATVKRANLANRSKKIVIISEVFKNDFEANQLLKDLHELNLIEYIDGEARDTDCLEKACIHKAKTVILLSENVQNSDMLADERTLLRALSISSFCKEKYNKLSDEVYMIAEVKSEKYRKALIAADVNEIICTSRIAHNVITQSALNHGISDVLDEILAYDDNNNEFYTIDLLEYPNLAGYTYDELLPVLRKHHMLLLGIKAVYYTQNAGKGKVIIDRDKIEERLKKDKRNITRPIMINPLDDTESSYVADSDDQLIVFAKSEKVLKRLKKIDASDFQQEKKVVKQREEYI